MSSATSKPAEAPTIPRVPWNPLVGALFVVIVYFASQLIAGVLVSLYPLSRSWSHAKVVDWVNNSVGAQFIYIVLAEAMVVGAVYWFLRLYKQAFVAIGLKRPQWHDLLYGLGGLPFYLVLYFTAVTVISHFVPSLNVSETQQLGFNNVSGALPLALTFVSLVVLPPLAEEILVRGFLYSSLKKGLPTAGAVIATSAIFGIAHLDEGGSAGLLYIAAIDTFVLSLVLIYLREKTGGLWASITLHATKNGIAFASLFVLHLK